MAEVKKSLIKSNLSIAAIQDSVSSFGEGLSKARSSATQLQENLIERNAIKRKALKLEGVNFHRRRQAVQRKNAEDTAELSTLGGARRRVGNLGAVIANSTRGFFGRVLDVVSVIALGWIINDLPKIIEGIKGVITKINRLVSVVSGFVQRVGLFVSGIFGILTATLSNILKFDFSDSEGKLKRSITKVQLSLGLIDQEMSQAKLMSDSFSVDGSGGGGGEIQQQPVDTEGVDQAETESKEGQLEEIQKEEEKPQGFMRGLTGFADAITGDTWNFDKQDQTPNTTEEKDKPQGFMRGLAGFGDLVTGNAFDFDKKNKPPEVESPEPQTPLVNMSGILPTDQEAGDNWANTLTQEDMDAVNQEREMFGQKPIQEKGIFTPAKAKPNLGTWTGDGWQKNIGVEIYPEGNLLERQNLQSKSSNITPERRGRVVYVQKQPSSTAQSGGGSAGGSSTKVRWLNSSRELARQITLNSLQYT